MNMATSDLEERQLALEGKICSLPATRLEELAEHLKVPLTKYSGNSWFVVARLLREAIVEGVESCETLELKKEYLCGIENVLADKPPPLAGVAEVTEGKAKDSGGKNVPVVDVNKILGQELLVHYTAIICFHVTTSRLRLGNSFPRSQETGRQHHTP